MVDNVVHSRTELTARRTTPSQHGGAAFGPYRLLDSIGRGGMAEVILAADPRRAGVHRLVAVKRIHPHLLDEPGFVDMFHDEARFASQLCHPNVCRVFDHGVIDDRPFLAMEYLCGEPLNRLRSALAETSPRPNARWRVLTGARRAAFVARIVTDACEGLQAVHELRTGDGRSLDAVHRDVSPENLFLTCAGEVKVVDFGVVKANHKRHKTDAGVIKGKMAYLAPEVMSSTQIDRRADIWALGIIAWELLTGERLFRRDSDVETLKSIINMEIPLPSSLRSDIPEAVETAVMRALERDPTRRYASARAFGMALRKAAPGVDHADVAAWVGARFGHDSLCHQRCALSSGALDSDENSVSLTLTTMPPTVITAKTPSSRPPAFPARARSRRAWRTAALLSLGITAGAAAAAFATSAVEPRLQPLGTQLASQEGAMGAVSNLVRSGEDMPLYVEVRDASGAQRLRVTLDALLAEQLKRAAQKEAREPPPRVAQQAPRAPIPPPERH